MNTETTDVQAQMEGVEAPAPAPTEAPAAPVAIDMTALAATIKANYDFNVDVKPVAFHFKTVKDPDTKVETKRPSVNALIPYPSVQGIIDILQKDDNEKEMALLLDAVEGIVTQQARAMIADDEAVNAETLDVNKLSWAFIASMPKPERTGGGIPKEAWESFVDDYKSVMKEAAGKNDDQVAAAGKILLNKFAAVKTNMPVLEMLVDQIAIYAEHSADIETHLPCVEFLTDKAQKLLNVSPEELLAAL